MKPFQNLFIRYLSVLLIGLWFLHSHSSVAADLPDTNSLSDESLDSLLLGSAALLPSDLDPESPGKSTENEPSLSEAEVEKWTEALLKEMPLPEWEQDITLLFIAGHSDNPLLTHTQKQSSLFTGLELEYLRFRLPGEKGNKVFFYGLVEHRRYKDAGDLEDETLALAQIVFQKSLGSRWSWDSTVLGLYNDQVFGLSPTEDEVLTSPITVIQGTLRQDFTFKIGENLEWKTGFQVDRVTFQETGDDYWQPGFTTEFSLEQGNWTHSLQLVTRLQEYDDRLQQNLNGIPIPDTRLATSSYEPRIRIEWEGPSDYSPELGMAFSTRLKRDNRSGYQDSNRHQWKFWISREWGAWFAELESNVSWYDYLNRTAGPNHPERYELTQIETSLSIDRRFTPHWVGSLQATRQETQSTQILDSYIETRGTFSLQYTF